MEQERRNRCNIEIDIKFDCCHWCCFFSLICLWQNLTFFLVLLTLRTLSFALMLFSFLVRSCISYIYFFSYFFPMLSSARLLLKGFCFMCVHCAVTSHTHKCNQSGYSRKNTTAAQIEISLAELIYRLGLLWMFWFPFVALHSHYTMWKWRVRERGEEIMSQQRRWCTE